MNLKKSDKMIAVIAVVILVIAAIGIILYTEEEPDENGSGTEDELKLYLVESELIPKPETIAEGTTIKPALIGDKTMTYDYSIGGNNIKNITFCVNYSDSNPGILGLIGAGKDTLKVKIMNCQGEEVGSDSSQGSGSFEIPIELPTRKILGPFEAETYDGAMENLTNQYQYFNDTYSIKVTLDAKFLFKLREMIFGKDNFDITVTYCYYDYKLVEEIPDDDDEPPTEIDPSSYSSTPYSSLLSTGFH